MKAKLNNLTLEIECPCCGQPMTIHVSEDHLILATTDPSGDLTLEDITP